MSVFRETLEPATAEQCQANWCCAGPGVAFRCGFCGHKFVEGDLFRALYTNDLPDAGGNPFVCRECNAETSELRKRWQEKRLDWASLRAGRFWWFATRNS